MKAVSVHGGGDELERISTRFGLRGQYAPCIRRGSGTAMVTGRDDDALSPSGPDMALSSDSGKLTSLKENSLVSRGDWERRIEVLKDCSGDMDFRFPKTNTHDFHVRAGRGRIK
jgi:hypothetical protein